MYFFFFFFFNDTATTEIYTLSLHDALPISHTRGATIPVRSSAQRAAVSRSAAAARRKRGSQPAATAAASRDRKSTRLNSSHGYISYAVFCLKKKKKHTIRHARTHCSARR